MFTWMAIDRTNVSSVLTSTFLSDTSMMRDQANTGVSLLWLGIVLLEMPSPLLPFPFLENSEFASSPNRSSSIGWVRPTGFRLK